jgi:hypothetical protein
MQLKKQMIIVLTITCQCLFYTAKEQIVKSDSLLLNEIKTVLTPLAPVDKSFLKDTGTELFFLLLYAEKNKIVRYSIYSKMSSEIYGLFCKRIDQTLIGYRFSMETPSIIFIPVVFCNPFSKNYRNDALKTAYHLSEQACDNASMIFKRIPSLFLLGEPGIRQSRDDKYQW